MRKHHTQMTRDEYKRLLDCIRSRSFVLSTHACDRMSQKQVSENDIRAMLTYCAIIEMHNDIVNELRVLVRGKVRGQFVCAVLSLTTGEIVTTYRNQAGDYHATLDRSVYTWTVSVFDALKQFQCE